MKKIVFASVLALGSLTAISATTPVVHDGIMDVVLQEEFTEISADELPQAVKDALAADFPNATLDKVSVNENKEYKLEVTIDGTASVLYASEDGEWIQK
ncbi:hypothetical protein [Sinomicrobium weinanense]|uniref:Beta-lactamase-inhibitor-like PepSY-like domain-containing protein n=1 Tax=Sinomicrobium weinanense TaxID=2842200 RepID=A0A926JQF4_9FLAO|nr:hypothetical protein [Sinomicrobium weinanense]MBC9795402.1 hypothetical protein [Sinomicrobium weinanense]MBU3123927.1 hypothetical protein [Sinomicrobium weinanense]